MLKRLKCFKTPTEKKAVNTTLLALNFLFLNREQFYEAFRCLCISTFEDISNQDLNAYNFLAFLHGIVSSSKCCKLPTQEKENVPILSEVRQRM